MGAPADHDPGYRNLIAFSRALTRWGSKGELSEADGAVLCASGSWIPLVGNSAYRDRASVPGTDLVARADDFFGGLARGFVLFDDQHRAVLVAQTQRQREANYACANDDDVPVLHLSIVVQRDVQPQPRTRECAT